VLLAAAGLEPELTALSDRASARLLALAHLSEGRATAATVRTLIKHRQHRAVATLTGSGLHHQR